MYCVIPKRLEKINVVLTYAKIRKQNTQKNVIFCLGKKKHTQIFFLCVHTYGICALFTFYTQYVLKKDIVLKYTACI